MDREEIKIIIIGDTGVGKSSLTRRLINNTYRSEYIRTVGVEIFSKSITSHGKQKKLNIFDTSGGRAFRMVRSSFYRDAVGIILVYDVTKPKSLEHVIDWYKACGTNANPSTKFLLVGNRSDLEMRRRIPTELGQMLAKTHGFSFIETSAKLCDNIEEIFLKIFGESNSQNLGGVDDLHKKRLIRHSETESKIKPRPKPKKKCCSTNCFMNWLFR